jgi:hypothetical protein
MRRPLLPWESIVNVHVVDGPNEANVQVNARCAPLGGVAGTHVAPAPAADDSDVKLGATTTSVNVSCLATAGPKFVTLTTMCERPDAGVVSACVILRSADLALLTKVVLELLGVLPRSPG